jgi:uncharacterized protein (TIGR03437 family)
MEAPGKEKSAGFSLGYDQALLTNPVVTLGADARGAALSVDNSQTAQGKLGIAVSLPGNRTLTGDRLQLVKVAFKFTRGGQPDFPHGTGSQHRSSLEAVKVLIDGIDAPMFYAGPQGGYAGLDQFNIELPRSLAGRGLVDVVLTVDGVIANAVQIRVSRVLSGLEAEPDNP